MRISKTGALVDTNPTFSNPLTFEVDGMSRTVDVDNLSAGTHYYVKGYVVADGQRVYSSNIKNFKTELDCFTIKNEYSGQNTITIQKEDSGMRDIILDYSIDNGENWETWNSSSGAFTLTIESGKKIKFKGDNAELSQTNYAYYVSATENYSIAGNIMTLVDSTGLTTTMPDNMCKGLFKNSTNLISTKDLNFGNVTSIPYSGMNSMFSNCTSLVDSPNLQNIVSIGRRGLEHIFYNCSSLVEAPDLHNLISIDIQGLATSFTDCISLVDPPDLHNLTSISKDGLRDAFRGCESLEAGLDFRNVTSIDQYSLTQLYATCRNLKTAYTPNLSTWNTSNANLWLTGAGSSVTGTKILYISSNLCVGSGTGCIPQNSWSGIPSNWTYQTY